MDPRQPPIPETKIDNYPVEVKYFEAAIQALASGKDKDESARVKNFGTAILNVAIKTKRTFEANQQEGEKP